jgi:hypothetical protein
MVDSRLGLGGSVDTFTALRKLHEYSQAFGDQRKRLITIFLSNGELAGLDRGSVVAEVGQPGHRNSAWAFALDNGNRRNLLQLSKCECRIGEASAVSSMLARLQSALCPAGPSQAEPSAPPGLMCVKRLEVDLLLLVDTSRNMRSHFEEVKAAARAIVSMVPFSFGARVAIVSFSDIPTSHIRLVDYQDGQNIAVSYSLHCCWSTHFVN